MQEHRQEAVPEAADPKDAPVQLIERKLAHKGAVLNVYDDYVEVKGKRTHWDYIHHDGAAAVLPVLPDGRLLMVRQYRHALSRYTLEIPAGKVDSPEEPKIDCARRELEEETGYRSDHLTPLLNMIFGTEPSAAVEIASYVVAVVLGVGLSVGGLKLIRKDLEEKEEKAAGEDSVYEGASPMMH